MKKNNKRYRQLYEGLQEIIQDNPEGVTLDDFTKIYKNKITRLQLRMRLQSMAVDKIISCERRKMPEGSMTVYLPFDATLSSGFYKKREERRPKVIPDLLDSTHFTKNKPFSLFYWD